MFSAGAWDGSFQESALLSSHTVVGSCGQCLDDSVYFIPPSDMYLWLNMIVTETKVLVSNSLAFLLSSAQEELCIEYPDYHFDLLHFRRWGLRKPTCELPTKSGRSVQLVKWENFSFDSQLNFQIHSKPHPAEPQDFQEYFELLSRSVKRTIDNANDHSRQVRYSPKTTISTGYDSTTLSVLATAAGCREALTFCTQHQDLTKSNDSGLKIGQLLGLQVKEYPRRAYQDLTNLVEAEFSASMPRPGGAPMAVAEPEVEGSILLMGRPGEDFWGLDEICNLPDLICPDAQNTAGSSYNEFFLRTGTLQFRAAYIGAIHRLALQRISLSKEMMPWRIGGTYDRPICRRIVEEAGVPREMFGQDKQGGSAIMKLTDATLEDFQQFYEQAEIPEWFRSGTRFRGKDLWDGFIHLTHWLSATRKFQPQGKQLYKALIPLTMLSSRKTQRAINWGLRFRGLDWRFLYLFHWGIERIKPRYQLPEEFSRNLKITR